MNLPVRSPFDIANEVEFKNANVSTKFNFVFKVHHPANAAVALDVPTVNLVDPLP